MRASRDPSDSTSVPQPRSVFCESEEVIGDHLFLYSPDNDLVYQLNDGAAVVWLMCDGASDLNSIAEQIGETYQLPVQDALEEVRAAVNQFESLGLLES